MFDTFFDYAFLLFIGLFLMAAIHLFLFISYRKKRETDHKIYEEKHKELKESIREIEKKVDEVRLQIGIINGTFVRTIHIPATNANAAAPRPRGRPPKKIENKT